MATGAFQTPQKQNAYCARPALPASPFSLLQTPSAFDSPGMPAARKSTAVELAPFMARQLSLQLSAGKAHKGVSPRVQKPSHASPTLLSSSPWSASRMRSRTGKGVNRTPVRHDMASSNHYGSPTPPRYQQSSPRAWRDKQSNGFGEPLDDLSGLLKHTLTLSVQKKKKLTYDRFVPDTTTYDFTTTQFLFECDGFDKPKSGQTNEQRNDIEDAAYMDATTRLLQQDIAQACGIALNQRILQFDQPAPINEREQMRERILNPFGLVGGKQLRTKRPHQRRQIPVAPVKVLDAPGLATDFYLNVVDWSSTNQLAIALGNTVYIMNAGTNEVTEFCTVNNSSSSRADATQQQNTTANFDNGDEDVHITSLSWALDGSHLAVGTRTGQTQIWDVESGTRLRKMGGHAARVGVLAWENYMVSSGSMDGSIWRHDVRISDHNVAKFHGHELEVCGLKYQRAAGGEFQCFASGGNDNIVNIWDVRNAEAPVHSKSDHTAAVKALAWSPHSSNLLATGGGTADANIHFWNSYTGALLNTIHTGAQVTSLVWSREYKELLSAHGYPSNHMTLWSYPTLYKVADFEGHSQRILHMCASPDGQMVATAAVDENIKFWHCWQPGTTKGNNNDDSRDQEGGISTTSSIQPSSSGSSEPPISHGQRRLPNTHANGRQFGEKMAAIR